MNTSFSAPAFQFYPADHFSDARIMRMSAEEEYVYLRLLFICWREGRLDNNPEWLTPYCKGASVETVKAVLDCFEPHPENPQFLIHPHLEKEREKQREWREKSAAGGRKSAESRRASASKSKDKPASKDGSKGGSTLQSPSSSPTPPSTPCPPSESKNTPLPPRGNPADLPLASQKNPAPSSHEPVDELRPRIGALLGRRPDSRWSVKELKALRHLGPPDAGDLALIETYYRAEIPAEKDFRRRSLVRLLTHWETETDHARRYVTTTGKVKRVVDEYDLVPM